MPLPVVISSHGWRIFLVVYFEEYDTWYSGVRFFLSYVCFGLFIGRFFRARTAMVAQISALEEQVARKQTAASPPGFASVREGEMRPDMHRTVHGIANGILNGMIQAV